MTVQAHTSWPPARVAAVWIHSTAWRLGSAFRIWGSVPVGQWPHAEAQGQQASLPPSARQSLRGLLGSEHAQRSGWRQRAEHPSGEQHVCRVHEDTACPGHRPPRAWISQSQQDTMEHATQDLLRDGSWETEAQQTGKESCVWHRSALTRKATLQMKSQTAHPTDFSQ